MKFKKVFFVTQSDTARGPMAAFIMKEKYPIVDLEVFSKGLVVLFQEPMNPKAELILGKHGIIPTGYQSNEFKKEEVDESSLVLVMDEYQYQKLKSKMRDFPNIYLFSEFLGLEGNVLNPYGGNLEEYDKCYETIEGMVKLLVLKLSEEA